MNRAVPAPSLYPSLQQAAWLDTSLFAPHPLPEIEALGVASRPGMRIIRTSEARLRVRSETADGRPTVVILPDGPNTIEHHDLVFDRLRGRYAVVAIEIPGLGFSYAQSPSALTFEGTVAAVASTLKTLGVDQLVLTGSCVQAYVAIAVASSMAGVTSGVIASQATDLAKQKEWIGKAVDPQGFLGIPLVGQLAWARSGNRQRMSNGWYDIAAGEHLDTSGWKETANWALRCGSCYALASLVQNWFGTEEIVVPVWAGPAAVLFGSADRTHLSLSSDPKGLLRYLPSAAVKVLPDAGHFPELEAIDEFIRAIDELFATTQGF